MESDTRRHYERETLGEEYRVKREVIRSENENGQGDFGFVMLILKLKKWVRHLGFTDVRHRCSWLFFCE
jgi:hypothetical protein